MTKHYYSGYYTGLYRGHYSDQKASGFTLIELSMVLVVAALLIGSMIDPLNQQLKNSKVESTKAQLQQIHDALMGFAIANNRLPCPTLPGHNGNELRSSQTCTAQHGFIPMNTLSLTGARDSNTLLLDAWHQPIRYSVSSSDMNTDNGWDFFQDEGLIGDLSTLLQSDPLIVCDGGTGSVNSNCSAGSNPIAGRTPALFFSTGANHLITPSANELENLGAIHGSSGIAIPNDRIFADAPFSSKAGAEFDDLIMWVSPNILYLRLVQSGHL